VFFGDKNFWISPMTNCLTFERSSKMCSFFDVFFFVDIMNVRLSEPFERSKLKKRFPQFFFTLKRISNHEFQ